MKDKLTKEEVNEVQTLVDGLINDLQDIKNYTRNIEWKLKEIEEIINIKKEEEF